MDGDGRYQRSGMNSRIYPAEGRRSSGAWKGRLIIGLVLAAAALFSYFGSSSVNPVTGEKQHIGITAEQEIALGLQSAPQMAAQHGGLHPDERVQALVDRVGESIVEKSPAGQTGYPFEFHALADPNAVNAFALPGGQVFITAALLARLETEGELAGVLAHEIAHVVGRHSAEHLAKAELTEGLTGAVVMTTYDPENPGSMGAGQMAAIVGQLVNLKFGRDDELESDQLGVSFMSDAGYDPRSMIRVQEILAAVSGGGAPPEFYSTHPNPDNRIARIQEAIAAKHPGRVPDGMIR